MVRLIVLNVVLVVTEAIEHLHGQVLLVILNPALDRIVVIVVHFCELATRLGFFARWRAVIAQSLLPPVLVLVLRAILVDSMLLFLEALEASQHDRWRLVNPGDLFDLKEEVFELPNVFVHRFVPVSLIEIL